MPLDVSGIDPQVFDKLNKADIGKYSTASMLVSISKKPTQTVANTIVDLTVPINKKKFPKPETFWTTVDTKRNSELYKILKHNSSVFYVVLPNFKTFRDFQIKPNTDTIPNEIKALNADNYIIGGNGPFAHNFPIYSTTGPIYINSVLISSNPSNPGNASIRYEHPSSANGTVGSLKIKLGDVDAVGITPGATFDGMSSLPPLIINSVYKEGYDKNFKPSTNGSDLLGGHIFAYNSVKDTAFVIIRAHGAGKDGWEMDTIREGLIHFGFENAIFFDGSDSVYLVEFIGPGKYRVIVNSMENNFTKRNNIDQFYAIEY